VYWRVTSFTASLAYAFAFADLVDPVIAETSSVGVVAAGVVAERVIALFMATGVLFLRSVSTVSASSAYDAKALWC